MSPRIVAHRGATCSAPENSVAAFEDAKALGADGVEFDVQWTADQRLVVAHAFDAGGCTDGSGLFADLTRDEVQRLTVTSDDSADHRRHRIPDFSEVLCLDGLTFEIDLKRADLDFIEQVLTEVDASGVLERCEFTSPFIGALINVGRLAPSALLGYFARHPPDGVHLGAYQRVLVEDCLALGLDVFHAPLGLLDDALTDRCHRDGLVVHAANVDEPADLRAVAELGADQLSTNRCDIAIAVFRNESGASSRQVP